MLYIISLRVFIKFYVKNRAYNIHTDIYTYIYTYTHTQYEDCLLHEFNIPFLHFLHLNYEAINNFKETAQSETLDVET